MFAGYVGSKSFLEKVADIVQDIKKINPSVTFGNVVSIKRFFERFVSYCFKIGFVKFILYTNR